MSQAVALAPLKEKAADFEAPACPQPAEAPIEGAVIEEGEIYKARVTIDGKVVTVSYFQEQVASTAGGLEIGGWQKYGDKPLTCEVLDPPKPKKVIFPPSAIAAIRSHWQFASKVAKNGG